MNGDGVSCKRHYDLSKDPNYDEPETRGCFWCTMEKARTKTKLAPDPAYPPEFEALDLAFYHALRRAGGDVPLMNKLANIMDAMSRVAVRSPDKAKAYTDAEGVL